MNREGVASFLQGALKVSQDTRDSDGYETAFGYLAGMVQIVVDRMFLDEDLEASDAYHARLDDDAARLSQGDR